MFQLQNIVVNTFLSIIIRNIENFWLGILKSQSYISQVHKTEFSQSYSEYLTRVDGMIGLGSDKNH